MASNAPASVPSLLILEGERGLASSQKRDAGKIPRGQGVSPGLSQGGLRDEQRNESRAGTDAKIPPPFLGCHRQDRKHAGVAVANASNLIQRRGVDVERLRPVRVKK